MMGIDWDLFWHMGGYGVYVWSGWGAAVLALGAEFGLLWWRARRLPAPSAAAGRGGPGVPTARSGEAPSAPSPDTPESGRSAEGRR